MRGLITKQQAVMRGLVEKSAGRSMGNPWESMGNDGQTLDTTGFQLDNIGIILDDHV